MTTLLSELRADALAPKGFRGRHRRPGFTRIVLAAVVDAGRRITAKESRTPTGRGLFSAENTQ